MNARSRMNLRSSNKVPQGHVGGPLDHSQAQNSPSDRRTVTSLPKPTSEAQDSEEDLFFGSSKDVSRDKGSLENTAQLGSPISFTRQNSAAGSPQIKPSNVHVRVYQACNNCRKNKVRCVVGSVDDPHLPCRKCNREGKECIFEPYRRGKISANVTVEQQTTSSSGNDATQDTSKAHAQISPKRGAAEMADESEQGSNEDSDSPEVGLIMDELMLQGLQDIDLTSTAAMMKSLQNLDQLKTAIPGTEEDDPGSRVHPLWHLARQAWKGWFLPSQGEALIQFFYHNIASQTLVRVPDYAAPEKHGQLMTTEPVLALTMLAIASRFLQFEEHGAVTRRITRHCHLSSSLQRIIDDILLIQQRNPLRLGGDVFLAPDVSLAGEQNETTEGFTKLQWLGTIESLLLLAEFPGLSLHLPDSAPDHHHEFLIQPATMPDFTPLKENEVKTIRDWSQPALRCERISWNLIDRARSLAKQLGIFSPLPDAENFPGLTERIDKIRRVFFIYGVQTSPMAYLSEWKASPELAPPFDMNSLQMVEYSANQEDGVVQEVVLRFWTEISKFHLDVIEKIMPNDEATRKLIDSGDYLDSLADFGLRMMDLRKNLDQCKLLPKPMRRLLEVEYDYNKVKLFDVAMRAGISRLLNDSSPAYEFSNEYGVELPDVIGIADGSIPPQIVDKWFYHDRIFVNELVKAGQNVLRNIIDGLKSGERLRYAPARLFFRAILVALSLLRTFSMAQTMSGGAKTLELLAEAVEAMRANAADDIHINTYAAEMLLRIGKRIVRGLVRFETTKKPVEPPRKKRAIAPVSVERAQLEKNLGVHLSSWYNLSDVSQVMPDPSSAAQSAPNALPLPHNSGGQGEKSWEEIIANMADDTSFAADWNSSFESNILLYGDALAEQSNSQALERQDGNQTVGEEALIVQGGVEEMMRTPVQVIREGYMEDMSSWGDYTEHIETLLDSSDPRVPESLRM